MVDRVRVVMPPANPPISPLTAKEMRRYRVTEMPRELASSGGSSRTVSSWRPRLPSSVKVSSATTTRTTRATPSRVMSPSAPKMPEAPPVSSPPLMASTATIRVKAMVAMPR